MLNVRLLEMVDDLHMPLQTYLNYSFMVISILSVLLESWLESAFSISRFCGI